MWNYTIFLTFLFQNKMGHKSQTKHPRTHVHADFSLFLWTEHDLKVDCMYQKYPVYVCCLLADKWKHCVHVFNAEGTYLRQLGKKGHAEGHFESPEGITSGPGPNENDDQTFLYVCDTGNDRVQASTAPVIHMLGSRCLIDASYRTHSLHLFTN
jgi:hypothetical protein